MLAHAWMFRVNKLDPDRIKIKYSICTCPCLVCLQKIMATVNNTEQKRLLMDLDINMRCASCQYTVQFYGALFREVRKSFFVLRGSVLPE